MIDKSLVCYCHRNSEQLNLIQDYDLAAGLLYFILYYIYRAICYTGYIQGGPKKSKPDNFCNNFVYCHPIFIIFGTYTLQEICNRRMYS